MICKRKFVTINNLYSQKTRGRLNMFVQVSFWSGLFVTGQQLCWGAGRIPSHRAQPGRAGTRTVSDSQCCRNIDYWFIDKSDPNSFTLSIVLILVLLRYYRLSNNVTILLLVLEVDCTIDNMDVLGCIVSMVRQLSMFEQN